MSHCLIDRIRRRLVEGTINENDRKLANDLVNVQPEDRMTPAQFKWLAALDGRDGKRFVAEE